MRSAEAIQADLADCKAQLQEEYPISALGGFGSYARGDQDAESDPDVLVEFEGSVTLFALVRLEHELTRRLGVDVDLVTRDSLKPRIETRVGDDIVYVLPRCSITSMTPSRYASTLEGNVHAAGTRTCRYD